MARAAASRICFSKSATTCIGDAAGQHRWARAACRRRWLLAQGKEARRMADFPTTREIPLDPKASALLFIDVQNFSVRRDGGEFKDVSGQRNRRQVRLLFRAPDVRRHPQHAAAAGRLPGRRHRGALHDDRKPDQGRPRPQPRLQDHRLPRAEGLMGRQGDRRDRTGRGRDRAAEDLVERLRLDPHRLSAAQSRRPAAGALRARDRPVRGIRRSATPATSAIW